MTLCLSEMFSMIISSICCAAVCQNDNELNLRESLRLPGRVRSLWTFGSFKGTNDLFIYFTFPSSGLSMKKELSNTSGFHFPCWQCLYSRYYDELCFSCLFHRIYVKTLINNANLSCKIVIKQKTDDPLCFQKPSVNSHTAADKDHPGLLLPNHKAN